MSNQIWADTIISKILIHYIINSVTHLKNWSQEYNWRPAHIHYPESEAAIQSIIQKAAEEGKRIRIIGTGHSFNPLWVTDQILVNLDKYQGLVDIDSEKNLATVKAGTKLHLLGALLYEQGLAMENMGDIDAQSIGGTISTGTHGTGLAFGTISTQVRKIRFINGKGEIKVCSSEVEPELFKAAQVSLGALGIITEITLQCVPAYRLELINGKEPLQDVLSTFQERIQTHRNFEFYWFPHTQSTWTKTSNIVTDVPDKINAFNYFS
ncbi:MAG: FAD-binding protein, partial [Bacteroidota bacterium]